MLILWCLCGTLHLYSPIRGPFLLTGDNAIYSHKMRKKLAPTHACEAVYSYYIRPNFIFKKIISKATPVRDYVNELNVCGAALERERLLFASCKNFS